MKISARLTACCLLGSSILAIGSAKADLIDLTFRGTVIGYDQTAIFGATSISGSYQADYIFDDSVGTPTSGAGYDFLQGAGAASPGRATLTINGISRSFDGAQDSLLVKVGDPSPNSEIFAQVDATETNYIVNQIENNISFLATGDFEIPFSYTVEPSDHTGESAFSIYDPTSGVDTYGNLTPQFVQVADVKVPEAPGWALMLSGILGLSVAIRRSRR